MTDYYFLRQNLLKRGMGMIAINGMGPVSGSLRWLSGSPFSVQIPVEELPLNPAYGERMPDFFDALAPVMSNKLISALRASGVDNIDTYPVVLSRMDNGKKWNDYALVNVLGKLDAIDMEKSSFDGSSSLPDFTRIVLDPRAVGGALCFRLRKHAGYIVIVESVAKVLMSDDFFGLLLQPVSEFDGD